MSAPPRHRRSPLTTLALLPALGLLGLVVALGLVGCSGGSQPTPTQTPTPVPVQGTVVALQTAVASQQALAAARGTVIAQQQYRIEQLQHLLAVTPTPGYQANGPHHYLASFQLDRYSYVLAMQWDESDGFVRNGRLLTTDNYARNASKEFALSGIDNNGSYGFTGRDRSGTITFTGTANSDGTFTVTGLPWSVFTGFVGGTFTRVLHVSTPQEYQTAVANLATPTP